MKKLFTLIAAVAFVSNVNAQTTETLAMKIDAYPWHYTADPGTDITLTFSSQYGEYGIFNATNAFPPQNYKGYKIVYEGAENVQVKIGPGNGLQFDQLDPNSTVLENDFSDKIKALESVAQFNIQCAESSGKVHIKSISLIKNDGTEEPLTSYCGGGWGRTLGPSPAPTITFTGQYGGLEIVTMDGSSCTYINDGVNTVEDEYTIELEEASTKPINIELDGASGGFNWFKIPEGTNPITFTISPSTCVEDKTEVPANMVKLYIKEDTGLKDDFSETDYFSIKVKRITRTRNTTGISNAIAAPADDNAPIYNLAGQKVDAGYKGVVIKNGKKFFQK